MDLSPSKVNRVANSCPGGLPAVAGIAFGAQATTAHQRLAAFAAVLAFTALAVRGYRLDVMCRDGELTVRGYLRTRVIPRNGITHITDFPAVRWTDSRGRSHWSPVWALGAGPRDFTAAAKQRRLAALRRWVSNPRRRPPGTR